MKKTETKSCPKVLPLLKENEDEEEKQIKEDLAKEKVKAELKLMEVRYKRHQNKITSTDTKLLITFSKLLLKIQGRVFYNGRKKKARGMKATIKEISISKNNGLLKTG